MEYDNSPFIIRLILVIGLVCAVLYPDSGFSQEDQRRFHNLEALDSQIIEVEKQLANKQAQFGSDQAKGREEVLKQEVEELSVKLDDLRTDFVELAAGEELALFKPQLEPHSFSWSTELRELLEPLINEVQRITAKPREIDALRTELDEFNAKMAVVERALANLNQTVGQSKDAPYFDRVLNVQKEWESRRNSLATQIGVVSHKLDERLSQQKSVTASLKEVFEIFFRSRGRNLLFSLLITIGFVLLVRQLYGHIQTLEPFKRGQARGLSVRLFNVLYMSMMGFGAMVVFLLALFFFGDWVLLVLGLIVFVGILWASKQAVPRFWNQVVLLLNIGPVREGERVIYNGLPWRVDSLNFHSSFVNPELEGGTLRIPIKDLPELRSRPFTDSEPWFPTSSGDWVLFEDRSFGQIISQTPEFVCVRLKGGALKNFSTADFISLGVVDLSKGFRLQASLGVDYALQRSVTSSVLEKLKNFVSKALADSGYQEKINLSIEFEEIGASALKLAVIADCDGSCAYEYDVLSRFLERTCVDACNTNDWIIPFDQLTVHMAGS